jgi:hypothetical protein
VQQLQYHALQTLSRLSVNLNHLLCAILRSRLLACTSQRAMKTNALDGACRKCKRVAPVALEPEGYYSGVTRGTLQTTAAVAVFVVAAP